MEYQESVATKLQTLYTHNLVNSVLAEQVGSSQQS